MKEETIKMTVADAQKLGIWWTDICDATGANVYAFREGLPEDTLFEIPVSLIRSSITPN